MGLLWRKGSTKYQKIVVVIFLLQILPLGFYLFFTSRNFLPSDMVAIRSLYVSVFLTVVFFVWLAVLTKKGLWAPAANSREFSPVKKFFIILFSPLFVAFILWVDFAYCFSDLANDYVGKEEYIVESVSKKHTYSRYSCDYKLKSKSLAGLLFHMCVSEKLFNSLPDAEFKIQIKLKRSLYGLRADNFRVANS